MIYAARPGTLPHFLHLHLHQFPPAMKMKMNRIYAKRSTRRHRNTGFQPVRLAGFQPAEASHPGALSGESFDGLEARRTHRLEACVTANALAPIAWLRMKMMRKRGDPQ